MTQVATKFVCTILIHCQKRVCIDCAYAHTIKNIHTRRNNTYTVSITAMSFCREQSLRSRLVAVKGWWVQTLFAHLVDEILVLY